jgi:EAL domain-containing protein (putative c-di-GMP-specific phosphodiesterase class I)/CheY-like chemotaxis protein
MNAPEPRDQPNQTGADMHARHPELQPKPADDIRLAFVVDDEAEVRAFVSKVLAAAGFAVQQLRSFNEVALALAHGTPDVIILDLSLGSSDAIEVIRILSLGKYQGDVVLISGHDAATLAEVAEIGKNRGLSMLAPLQKPFRVNALRDRLAQVADHASLAEESRSLDMALRYNWLELWYQPKVNLRSRTICGAEALIRLRHPSRGLMAPASFLPPPGDALYSPLTDFIVGQALADWSRFARASMTSRLAINVPASVLQHPNFVANLRQHLPTQADFPGLIVEITEDEAIKDPKLAREIAVQLKLYGIHVSIDDFGQGFSSLKRLRELPFAEIKLDRAYVLGCATDASKRAMCASVAKLARRFGIAAVAEGVETLEDLKTVVELGYDFGQGFYFARPMPSGELLKYIRKSA